MRPLAAWSVDVLKMLVGEAALNASHPIKAVVHFLITNGGIEGDRSSEIIHTLVNPTVLNVVHDNIDGFLQNRMIGCCGNQVVGVMLLVHKKQLINAPKILISRLATTI